MILQIRIVKQEISVCRIRAAKIDAGLPIFNYAVGYDLNNSEPLIYEKYPGSINDRFAITVYGRKDKRVRIQKYRFYS